MLNLFIGQQFHENPDKLHEIALGSKHDKKSKVGPKIVRLG